MSEQLLFIGLLAGFAVAVVTAPVGVSGAVFLLPAQLDLLSVPNPAVTPTNLLYNIVSAPGALVRYWVQGQKPGALAITMLWGTVPGVVVGAAIRVFVVPDAQTFRLVAAAVLLPIGVSLAWQAVRAAPPRDARPLSRRRIGLLGLAVGVAGGIYGIGGGSILAPLLVARGLAVATVAPAALAVTFMTSIVGTLAFALLSGLSPAAAAPVWSVGLACGVGGLLGGYLGARLSRHAPDRALRLLLGLTAIGVAGLYVAQSL